MGQQELFVEIRQKLDELLEGTMSMDERNWRTGLYANSLEKLINQYRNEETFNFMLEILRKIYESSKRRNYGNEGVILATTMALSNILGSE